MNIRVLAIVCLAVGLSACTGMAPQYGNSYSEQRVYRQDARCSECGTVQRIESYRDDRRTSGGGAVAGAVVGGLLGNQIGKGDGRKAATVVGAVAGGFAGNAIEREHNRDGYEISILLDGGRRLLIHQEQLNGVREGSRVFIRNGRAQLL